MRYEWAAIKPANEDNRRANVHGTPLNRKSL